MNRRKMITAAVTAGMLFGTLSAQAATQTIDGMKTGKGESLTHYADYSDTPDTESLSQMQSGVDTALESHRERMRQAPKEVLDGVRYTKKALRALRSGDKALAQKSLEAAAGLFQTALTNNPKLDLVPVADAVDVELSSETPAQISETLRLAKTALEEHRTQKARMLLAPLADQMTVSTQLLPMALYPKATTLALEQLKQGHEKAAVQTLRGAFSMLVSETEMLPLPLLRAQALTEAASGLDAAQTQEALALISRADDELKKAVLLGYTSADNIDYKRIKDHLAALKKSAEEDHVSGELYLKLRDAFDILLKKAENGLHKMGIGE